MTVTFVSENDFDQIKEANKHLKDDEGMVFVKCVLFKRETNSNDTMAGAKGVIMFGPRGEIKEQLLKLFETSFNQYDELMKVRKNEERY